MKCQILNFLAALNFLADKAFTEMSKLVNLTDKFTRKGLYTPGLPFIITCSPELYGALASQGNLRVV